MKHSPPFLFLDNHFFNFIYMLVCNIYPSTREQTVSCTDSVTSGSLVTKSCPILAITWTVACQAPLSMRFSRQEYWSGLPFPSPGDLPNPGIKPRSPALQADSLPTELCGKPSSQFTYPVFSTHRHTFIPISTYHRQIGRAHV